MFFIPIVQKSTMINYFQKYDNYLHFIIERSWVFKFMFLIPQHFAFSDNHAGAAGVVELKLGLAEAPGCQLSKRFGNGREPAMRRIVRADRKAFYCRLMAQMRIRAVQLSSTICPKWLFIVPYYSGFETSGQEGG